MLFDRRSTPGATLPGHRQDLLARVPANPPGPDSAAWPDTADKQMPGSSIAPAYWRRPPLRKWLETFYRSRRWLECLQSNSASALPILPLPETAESAAPVAASPTACMPDSTPPTPRLSRWHR